MTHIKEDKVKQGIPQKKTVFLAYVPFTGLGLYGGFRGNRWLRNRIKVFKQFVIPSLENQTDQDFVLWVGWRPEERKNPYVRELSDYLRSYTTLNFVFTFGGLCFWDDKYQDLEARSRLATSLHNTMPDLFGVVGEADEVIMLIQPSDDLYEEHAVRRIKDAFAADKTIQAVSYREGYHINYLTKEVHTYNPTTNPPFFAYKMPKETFVDEGLHLQFTGPYKSHEYIGDKMKLWHLAGRGFMVGSHTENISTHANHPFVGNEQFSELDTEAVLNIFGVDNVPNLVLPKSWRKSLMQKLPFGWQKKLRFLLGERLGNRLYQSIRN